MSDTVERLRSTYYEEFVDISFVAVWDEVRSIFIFCPDLNNMIKIEFYLLNSYTIYILTLSAKKKSDYDYKKIIQYNNSIGNKNYKVNVLYTLFLKFSALGLLQDITNNFHS